MPLTSSVMRQSISNFRLHCCSKKVQMLRKKVKLLLEQLQVCIFAQIVFGVRCTLMWNALCGLFFTVIQWPEKMKRSAIKQEAVTVPSEQSFVRKTFSL